MNSQDYMITEKKNQIKKEIKEKFVELSSFSTSHGYPNIFRTKYLSIKILWLFCLSIAIGLCLFLLIRGIKAYLEYGVVTSIEMVEERPALFPTISICDLNKFETNDSADLIKDVYFKEYGINLTEKIKNYQDVVLFYEDVYKLASAKAANPSFGDSNRKKLGFNLADILGWCLFNNDYQICDADKFEWSYDYTYGNCYKFNSGFNSTGKSVPLKYTTKPGYTNGLSLFLLIDETDNEYSRFNIQKYQGVVLFIHNNTHNPIISNGIQVYAGTNVNIGIKKTLTHKYPEPYSDCKDLSSFSSYFYDILTQSNKSYRQRDCFDLLLQRNIINNCSCYDLRYSQLYNATPCLNSSQLDCAEDIYLNFWNMKTYSYSSECPLECDFVDFDFTYSASDYDAYGLYTLLNGVKPTNDELNSFKNKVVSINVYFSELRYTEITETPSTSLIDLLANIGGTIGLFIGISVLSFVEIVEFLMEIIIIYYEKRKEARKLKIQN